MEQVKVRGTVRSAIIKQKPEYPNIIVSSVYSTKPVHFVSTSTGGGMVWEGQDIIVKNQKKLAPISFIRLNLQVSLIQIIIWTILIL